MTDIIDLIDNAISSHRTWIYPLSARSLARALDRDAELTAPERDARLAAAVWRAHAQGMETEVTDPDITDPDITDPVVVRLSMDGYIHGEQREIEIPRAEWNSMDDAQRRQHLDDQALGLLLDYVTPCWDVLSDEGEELRCAECGCHPDGHGL